MESMKRYFTYTAFVLCGIPEITLTGASKDYANILKRIDKIQRLIPDFAVFLQFCVKLHLFAVVFASSAKYNSKSSGQLCR
jgi:hypothetical protein